MRARMGGFGGGNRQRHGNWGIMPRLRNWRNGHSANWAGRETPKPSWPWRWQV